MRDGNVVPIEAVVVSAYRVPTATPESDGTFEWDSTTLVLVDIHAAGLRGLGYSYADKPTATLVYERFVNLLVGRDALAIAARWRDMRGDIRNLGGPGIAAMAISAVDNALWDWKAKFLGLPLVCRCPVIAHRRCMLRRHARRVRRSTSSISSITFASNKCCSTAFACRPTAS